MSKGDTILKWYKFLSEEKETYIHFDDYIEKVIIVARNNVVGNKLKKKIGEPTKTDTCNKQICCMQWEIPYSNRETIKKVLSINNFISMYKSSKED